MGTQERDIRSISTFVIHLWREGNPLAGGPLAWRGSIEHVQSGVRERFTDFQQVVAFLQSQTDHGDTPPTASRD